MLGRCGSWLGLLSARRDKGPQSRKRLPTTFRTRSTSPVLLLSIKIVVGSCHVMPESCLAGLALSTMSPRVTAVLILQTNP